MKSADDPVLLRLPIVTFACAETHPGDDAIADDALAPALLPTQPALERSQPVIRIDALRGVR